MTSLKAHRLIARAVADGVVKFSIDGKIVRCVQLQDRLCSRFGLSRCEIAPDLDKEEIFLRALDLASAAFPRR